MSIKEPSLGRDRVWLRLGIALMIVAPLLAVGAYFASYSGNDLEQRDAIVMALGALTVAVVGSALFLRYSLAGFLRFWLARFVYEHQTQTDRFLGVDPSAKSENA